MSHPLLKLLIDSLDIHPSQIEEAWDDHAHDLSETAISLLLEHYRKIDGLARPDLLKKEHAKYSREEYSLWKSSILKFAFSEVPESAVNLALLLTGRDFHRAATLLLKRFKPKEFDKLTEDEKSIVGGIDFSSDSQPSSIGTPSTISPFDIDAFFSQETEEEENDTLQKTSAPKSPQRDGKSPAAVSASPVCAESPAGGPSEECHTTAKSKKRPLPVEPPKALHDVVAASINDSECVFDVTDLLSAASSGLSSGVLADEKEEKEFKNIVHTLLKSSLTSATTKDSADRVFPLNFEQMTQVLHKMRAMVCGPTSATVVDVQPPVRIWGDTHGQFHDLIRFFKAFCGGTPFTDLAAFNYVFIGDYVDRGKNGLEVIFLLFAMKALFPNEVHLLRGNHEDHRINKSHTFLKECLNMKHAISESGRKYDGEFLFKIIHMIFSYLPLAARIVDPLDETYTPILCLHGGIGPNVETLDQIKSIARPIAAERISSDPKVRDILWSDPTCHKDVKGYKLNRRDYHVSGQYFAFGRDVLEDFCVRNNVGMIIRGHEPVPAGYQIYRVEGKRRLMTLFSATNYCDTEDNDGAMCAVTQRKSRVPGASSSGSSKPERLRIELKVVKARDNAEQPRDIFYSKEGRSPSPLRQGSADDEQ